MGSLPSTVPKIGYSRSVSIAHSLPAAPKFGRGGATLSRALDALISIFRKFASKQKTFILDVESIFEVNWPSPAQPDTDAN